MRAALKTAVNGLLGFTGLRLVSASWGPRGFLPAVERARARGFSPRCVVDVGASNGQWTRECRQVFPGADYLLVDPLEENRAALQALAASTPGLRFWSGALGAADGELALQAHGDQSSFLPSPDFPGVARQVPVRRLDTFLERGEIRGPLFIKADVQGFELEVLSGAGSCLAETGLLLLETSFVQLYQGAPLAHEIVGWLGQRGFRILDICTYLQRPGDRQLAQADLLFAPVASPLFGHEGWFAP
jgi:FkbM family methyltransferase